MTKRNGREDKPYLEWVREQPCAHCQRPGPSEPHHPRGWIYGAGASLKAPDYLAVPLCKDHHRAYHYGGFVDAKKEQGEWVLRTLLRAIEDGLWVRSPDA